MPDRPKVVQMGCEPRLCTGFWAQRTGLSNLQSNFQLKEPGFCARPSQGSSDGLWTQIMYWVLSPAYRTIWLTHQFPVQGARVLSDRPNVVQMHYAFGLKWSQNISCIPFCSDHTHGSLRWCHCRCGILHFLCSVDVCFPMEWVLNVCVYGNGISLVLLPAIAHQSRFDQISGCTFDFKCDQLPANELWVCMN